MHFWNLNAWVGGTKILDGYHQESYAYKWKFDTLIRFKEHGASSIPFISLATVTSVVAEKEYNL
jgi:hypothetical protein